MAEIRNYVLVRHLRADASSHIVQWKRAKVRRSGRGLAFWFRPMSSSLAEIPVDDREICLLLHGRTSDFQDVAVQGVVTYRVVDPEAAAARVDFTVDLRTGGHLRQPLERIALSITELAQQHALAYVAITPVRQLLAEGCDRIRERIESALGGDEGIAALGLEIVSVRISSVKPAPDLEKALEAPAREGIQQTADEAAFQRRALAVEKERAIQENELQNQIELARREEQLIAQRGQNARRQVAEQAEAARITTEGQVVRKRLEAEAGAERSRIEAEAASSRVRKLGEGRADSLRVVEGARAETDSAKMAIYRDVAPGVLVALAARELAGKLEKIEHLNIAPELLGPALSSLVEAGTRRLARDDKERV
jgi:hypothetical protein